MCIEIDSSFSLAQESSTSCDITSKFGNRSARFQAVREHAVRAVWSGMGHEELRALPVFGTTGAI